MNKKLANAFITIQNEILSLIVCDQQDKTLPQENRQASIQCYQNRLDELAVLADDLGVKDCIKNRHDSQNSTSAKARKKPIKKPIMKNNDMGIRIQIEHGWDWDEEYYRIVNRRTDDLIGYVGKRPGELWYYEKSGGYEVVAFKGFTSRQQAVNALANDVLEQ